MLGYKYLVLSEVRGQIRESRYLEEKENEGYQGK
jgi:hypothetical protein